MAHKIDLGKLIKIVDDTHQNFVDTLPVNQWGTPKTHRENRTYKAIKARHTLAVKDQVSFNPWTLFRIRRQANAYLRRFGTHRP